MTDCGQDAGFHADSFVMYTGRPTHQTLRYEGYLKRWANPSL